MKLHLGCGLKKLDGYINIDKERGDVCVDLEKEDLPYPSDSIEEILAVDVLEHIHNLIPLMNECHRVMARGGSFVIEVPRFPSNPSVSDPTHVRFFTRDTFRYFSEYTEAFPMYNIKQWETKKEMVTDDRIYITLSPVK